MVDYDALVSGEDIWLDAHQQEVWRTFHRMRTQLAMALKETMQLDSDLSEPDFEVLAILSEAPGGTLRARVLRCELQWEKSRLAHQIRRMEQRGLVAREDCIEDSRAPMIRITDAGLAAIRAAAPAHVARVRDFFFEALDAEQLDALHSASKAILARLADRRPTDVPDL